MFIVFRPHIPHSHIIGQSNRPDNHIAVGLFWHGVKSLVIYITV